MIPARACDRVRSLVEAAKRLVTNSNDTFAPDAALCRDLATASGLTEESVRWALESALEWRASDAEILELVRNAGPSVTRGPLVLILAANVTTAALRALACAVARAEDVRVYPSSRDAVLAHRLVEGAALDGVRMLASRSELPLADDGAHVVLYGAADTARTLRPLVRGSLEVHGPGLGLAVLTDETTRASLAALAEDISAFDQRGCLSPRLAIHVGSPGRGRELAAVLFEELDSLGVARPVGDLDAGELQDRTLALETARAIGDVWQSPRAAIAHETIAVASPAATARMLTIHTTPSWESAASWVMPFRPLLSAFGCDDPVALDRFLPDLFLRRSPLGCMQRPRFDGPVDRRPHGPAAEDSR